MRLEHVYAIAVEFVQASGYQQTVNLTSFPPVEGERWRRAGVVGILQHAPKLPRSG